MTEQTQRHSLLKVLAGLRLAIDGGWRPAAGVCSHVWVNWEAYDDDVYEELMNRWPERSGEWTYPVPCPIDVLRGLNNPYVDKLLDDDSSPANCAELAYNNLTQYEFWDKEHPYGAARLRLLDWMITELTTELGSKDD